MDWIFMPHQNPFLETLIPTAWRWNAEEVGMEGGDGVVVFGLCPEVTWEPASSLFSPEREHHEKMAAVLQEGQAEHSLSTVTLGFSASWTVRNACLFCKPMGTVTAALVTKTEGEEGSRIGLVKEQSRMRMEVRKLMVCEPHWNYFPQCSFVVLGIHPYLSPSSLPIFSSCNFLPCCIPYTNSIVS